MEDSYVNDFVLPSSMTIARKTFIDCEIVGPANLYWWRLNGASDLLGPQMDAIYLEPAAKFLNGITLDGCVFRGCSFQRITLLVSAPEYPAIKDHAILNWISETPRSIKGKATPLLEPSASSRGSPRGQRAVSGAERRKGLGASRLFEDRA